MTSSPSFNPDSILISRLFSMPGAKSLQLMPSSRSNDLSVSFSWPGANPEMLEMEVTSKLEGAFAPTKGLNAIRSYTGQGYGGITLSIDKHENIDAVKLYLSSLVWLYPPATP